MRPQLNAITLAVKDLVNLKHFYANVLNWEIMDENPDIVMFRLEHIILTLYKEKEHAKYLGALAGEHISPKFYFTLNTVSPQQTDTLFAELKAKGVTIVKEARQLFWGGYGGIITDLENNFWEICYNPMS
ncbi:VOC family protein [Mucilaginibacter sabulilitoris]|uniref:VOC family protein n=1 Tax=Mucilaginibacter sabulilitoris TaxID=1173583 RepID=A0ABZ0TH95_9SPHI|nr:VOC family protein [Mucilaginibacter sabulilitoris]WPU92565.1 VOC family protein [Mucilaginibacter sabulilitoris]